MSFIALSAFVGIALGILVGYFMTIWVLGLTTLVALYMLYSLFHPPRGARSAGLGMFLIFGPGLVTFLVCAWGAWFFAPGGVAYSIDTSAVWQSTKGLLFR